MSGGDEGVGEIYGGMWGWELGMGKKLHYLSLCYDDFFFNYEGINRVNR
jgi:hypothetical protein